MTVKNVHLQQALDCYNLEPRIHQSHTVVDLVLAIARVDVSEGRAIAAGISDAELRAIALMNITFVTRDAEDASKASQALDALKETNQPIDPKVEFLAWRNLIEGNEAEARRLLLIFFPTELISSALDYLRHPCKNRLIKKLDPSEREKRRKLRVARAERLVQLNAPSIVLVSECGLIAELGCIEEAQKLLHAHKFDPSEYDQYYSKLVIGLLREGREDEARDIVKLIQNPSQRMLAHLSFFWWSQSFS